MPVHVNSIGAATFFDLVGNIYPTQEQLEVIERPGVDGTGFRKTGARGKPFALVSIDYYDDWAAYQVALAGYATLTGEALQTVTRNSESYGDFKVLEVTEAEPPQAVLNVAGSPASQVRGIIRWVLSR